MNHHRSHTAAALLGPLFAALAIGTWVRAQDPPAGPAPTIAPAAKGPNQINLTWGPVAGDIYGYLIEIRSAADARYTNWTELRPIPKVAGYSCDPSVVFRGATCAISDPAGAHVYDPPTNGVPYWVTDANYTDPQDDTPAQFIAAGLKPNTAYTFRVRSYAGTELGTYSNIASARTAAYELRYVSPNGNDANPGTAADPAHAWRTLKHGAETIVCGQALIVMGGDYANDSITMQHHCTAAKKAVVMANPGDTPTLVSMAAQGAWHPMLILGAHIVLDGLRSTTPAEDYELEISGDYNAVFGMDIHPPKVPSFKAGLNITSSHNLVYGSAIHDYGSPDVVQNPQGNGGFVLTVQSPRGAANVIWSNHLTRGGHDVALCKAGCNHNRFLNNVMDGGWGMGFESVGLGGASDHNLIEGNIVKDVGRLVKFYKPSIEISSAHNTVRRNVSINAASHGLEQSAIGGSATDNLVYNNTFYAPASCLFQSAAGGSANYENDIYANNICYKFTTTATDIYNGNRTNRFTRNVIVAADPAGKLLPDKPIIVWNHSAGRPFENPTPLANADKQYDPVFSGNKGLDVDARFVNENGMDFHLAKGSPLIGKGVIIPDAEWGTAEGVVDVGAFGLRSIKVSKTGGPRQ